MKLPGWYRLSPAELMERGYSPKSERYMTPWGFDAPKRRYLNAQAEAVGYKSYYEYQSQAKKPMYKQILAASSNPKEARKLDSAFNVQWANVILPRIESGKKIGRDWWSATFQAADIPYENELYMRYHIHA
ncbi:MAG: hypothetical protein ACYDHE_17145 [Candidatus Acidiferrales bacterium]